MNKTFTYVKSMEIILSSLIKKQQEEKVFNFLIGRLKTFLKNLPIVNKKHF